MKATVGNLVDEVKEALIKMGYEETDRLDIDFINQVADEIGLPEAEVEGFSQVGDYRQHNEDGTF